MSLQAERKARYRALCATTAMPLFARDWWLDAVAGVDAWDVALVERGGQVHAALPWVTGRRLGLPVARMPPLTRSLGPWFRAAPGSEAARLGREDELTGELLAQLPRLARFQQALTPAVSNGLPWYWRGYTLETRYTYIIAPGRTEAALWDGLGQGTRNSVRKARVRHGLEVFPADDVATFAALHEQVFARQGRDAPVTAALLQRLWQAVAAHDAGSLLFARDAAGRVHAAVWIVRDAGSSYYLMGGSDPALRASGAQDLLLWEAVRHSVAEGRAFDFEGSMIPAIERVFRGFGAHQVPYLLVTRTDHRLLRLADLARALIRP